MKVLARLLVLLPLLSACAPEASRSGPSAVVDSAIIGGEEVKEESPLARSVVIVGQSGFEDCSATLLGESVALTAAHCVDPLLTGQPEFRADYFVKFRSPGLPWEERSVRAYVVNPRWRETTADLNRAVAEKKLLERAADPSFTDWGDLALVSFEGGLPAGYAPAELAGESAAAGAGTALVLAGFGFADSSLPDSGRGGLRRVNVAVARPAGTTELVINQANGRGSCKGDSGGPAFAEEAGKYFLLGATSRIIGPVEKTESALCRHESVYTDLRPYAAWIRAAAEELSPRD